ncbi:MAG: T9SS type A sorting domain-containing protein [Sphingobacteriaceae bacterium]|nr:T9SS type A sorting domain-containing protein [Sphingobacteriaceae bacterium]
MKKAILLFILAASLNVDSQITLDHVYKGGFYMARFGANGYKYVEVVGTASVNIYNLNHTLLNSFLVPPPYNNNLYSSTTVRYMYYVSDNLFDLDNGFEYAIVTNPSGAGPIMNLTIFNDSGSMILSKDSASFAGSSAIGSDAMRNIDAIYFDGLSTKMKIGYSAIPGYAYKRTEIYNLPGNLPCAGCTSGVVSSISGQGDNGLIEDAKFFPNPTSGQLKLKYKLPDGSHLAEMKIYDMQGKLVDEFKVTDTFDFIYLPTNYNNGLYLYSLIVDGKTIKTEKIVLNK